MSQAGATSTPGLWTSGNQLSAPEGALRLAENCVIRGKDVVEPRRGQTGLALNAIDADGLLTALHDAPGGIILAHQSTKLFTIDALGSTKTSISGTASAPDEALMRMHFANHVGRVYLVSSTGPQRLDPVSSGTLARAGRRRPNLKWSTSYAITNASGYLAAGKSVAYRAVLIDVDSANRYMVSAPSNRLVLSNPASSTSTAGNMRRTGGNLVTVTTSTAHGFKVGDTVTLTPGEANFASGAKVVTAVSSSTVFTYAEAGANVFSGSDESFAIGAASANVVVSFVGTGATTNTIVRLYRSVTTSGIPGEDVFLVYEGKPSAGDISSGSLTVSDNTPDSLVGDAAYFAASAGTLLAAKEEPPWAKTLAVMGERMLYANCRGRHLQPMQLLATGGSSGVISGTTITIVAQGVSIVCTGSTAYSEAGRTFTVYSGGTVSQDIEKTALGLVDLINNHPDNAGYVRAQYLSSADDSPGKFSVESLIDDTTSFTVTSTKGTAFNPQCASAVTSRQETKANRVFFSEPSEPDAVCPLSYVDVGSEDEQILRVMPLRSTTLVLKERSLWSIAGDWPNIRRTLVDPEMQLVAPDSAAVLANQVYALTAQGVAVMSEAGVGLVGLPVEEDLLPVMQDSSVRYGIGVLTLKRCAFGVGYETERQYLLGVRLSRDNNPRNVLTGNSATCSYVYVYNAMAKTWTRWPMERSCAVVERNTNQLWMGDSVRAFAWRENKNLVRGDYVDLPLGALTFTYTIGSITGLVVGLDKVDGLAVGDLLAGATAGNANAGGIITAVDSVARTVTLTSVSGLSVADTVRAGKAFECIVDPVAETGGAPSLSKQNQEVHFHFKTLQAASAEVWTSSELGALKRVHTFGIGGFGSASFGMGRFGDAGGPRNERAAISRDASRAVFSMVRFRCAEARQFWQLQGRTHTFNVESEKTGR